jgi:hypothetical protein
VLRRARQESSCVELSESVVLKGKPSLYCTTIFKLTQELVLMQLLELLVPWAALAQVVPAQNWNRGLSPFVFCSMTSGAVWSTIRHPLIPAPTVNVPPSLQAASSWERRRHACVKGRVRRRVDGDGDGKRTFGVDGMAA